MTVQHLINVSGGKDSTAVYLRALELGRPFREVFADTGHEQDCCESVTIEDINGDLSDLIGSPIALAEESTSNENPPDAKPETIEYQDDSFTWTFYRFATVKGFVTVRWYGSSNGYYGESVEFCES